MMEVIGEMGKWREEVGGRMGGEVGGGVSGGVGGKMGGGEWVVEEWVEE